MRATGGLGWIVVALAWTAGACGTPDEAPQVAAAAAPGPPAFPIAYGMEGVPGPWWKHGALRADFDRDLRVCRDRSTVARRAADPDVRLDTAYRAFLDCMLTHEWARGSPGPGDLAP